MNSGLWQFRVTKPFNAVRVDAAVAMPPGQTVIATLEPGPEVELEANEMLSASVKPSREAGKPATFVREKEPNRLYRVNDARVFWLSVEEIEAQ